VVSPGQDALVSFVTLYGSYSPKGLRSLGRSFLTAKRPTG
jgi:hypothetical protein